MTALNKQALIAKIKKQIESFDTVVLKEDEANALLDELEAAEKRIAEQQSAIIAPGIMRCAGCGFVLTKNNINMTAGTITAGDSKTEPCPNGCGPLWPVTWKEQALQMRDDSESWFLELQDAKKRIAELERSETQLINERDDAESALNDAYKAVMGQAPEWSNWFSFAAAIDEIELACGLWRNQTEDVIQFRQRIAELEARGIKPAKGEVIVVVSGFTGCGKSAIAGEIEIAMKAIGVPVQWTNGDEEKRMTGADWLTAIEMYKPTVRIVEVNVPRAAGIGVKGE